MEPTSHPLPASPDSVIERAVAARTREVSEQRDELAEALRELERTHAQLVQAQRLEAIGQLAAGVAHEINTPTQYVSDNLTFLKRAFTQLCAVIEEARAAVAEARGGDAAAGIERIAVAVTGKRLDYVLDQAPRALEQSREGVSRIASIVGAMKEFSHPSAGEKEVVDLAHALETTLTVARSEWKYVAEVHTEFDPALPHVPVLRNELNQAILNLVVNAAHAIGEVTDGGTRGKGLIHVSTRREGPWAVMAIRDTGSGISEAIRGRIFDPFFTTKPVGKGTGQGLAIAYNVVVERHGGRIEVESEVGKGSTFVVKLPIEARRSVVPVGR